MGKNRVVVIGAGFAGLSAAKYLANFRHLVEIILINKYENNHFRPLIPDVISGRVSAQSLLYPLVLLKKRLGFSFFGETVTGIDFKRNEINSLENKINYDYLIFAAGSQTAFPPNDIFSHFAFRLDNVHDASRMRDMVRSGRYNRFVVCGGGYTGVEVASNIQQFLKESATNGQVIIAEMADQLVGTLPVWMRHYITRNLTEMGIEVRLSSKVTDINEHDVLMSNGEHIKNALCIWTTGLEASILARSLDIDKNRKAQIKVDSTLRFNENSFASGDAACYGVKEKCIRMSVQCSLDQGRLAAENVIALICGNEPKKYNYRDPGFIVPLANGKSCGEILGVPVKGISAIMLHYLLSGIRSIGFYNRLGIIRGALHAL